jgi:hypothetical protein
MFIHDKIDYSGYKIGSRNKEKRNRTKKKHYFRRLNYSTVKHFFPKKIQMIMFRQFGSFVNISEYGDFHEKQHCHDNSRQCPYKDSHIQIAYELRFRECYDNKNAGNDKIGEDCYDESFVVYVFSFDNILENKINMHQEGNEKQ